MVGDLPSDQLKNGTQMIYRKMSATPLRSSNRLAAQ